MSVDIAVSCLLRALDDVAFVTVAGAGTGAALADATFVRLGRGIVDQLLIMSADKYYSGIAHNSCWNDEGEELCARRVNIIEA